MLNEKENNQSKILATEPSRIAQNDSDRSRSIWRNAERIEIQMKSFSELRKVFIQKQNETLPPIPKRLVNKPFFIDTTGGVFGVQRPRPIDRAAAMMLAKSRWVHAPTDVRPVKIKKAKKIRMKKKAVRVEKINKQEAPINIKQNQAVKFLSVEEALRLLK